MCCLSSQLSQIRIVTNFCNILGREAEFGIMKKNNLFIIEKSIAVFLSENARWIVYQEYYNAGGHLAMLEALFSFYLVIFAE